MRRPDLIQKSYDIRGVVQGVGFRPSIYRLATESGLGGWVQNRSGTVRLVLQGEPARIDRFVKELPGNVPTAAAITDIALRDEQPVDPDTRLTRFSIRPSALSDDIDVVIPADLRMCEACRRELWDAAGRRYRYPFTTCTDCGPRYTIIQRMPYDRERTTMAPFAMCDACRAEYEDAADRRFHAETIACPDCGPRLRLLESDGRAVPGDAMAETRQRLSAGRIVAVRGIGGFLLAANAFDRDAVSRLRARKRRPHKPFAVMARDLDTLRKFCRLSGAAEGALQSPEAPIVILDPLPAGDPIDALPLNLICPDTRTLGVMLPTSPIHELLFGDPESDGDPCFDLLIMTSGNRRGEPICLNDEDALDRLGGIADAFLTHDRDINLRNDDSLCIFQGNSLQVWRRARGYAPHPVQLQRPLRRSVLALGTDMKNAIAMGYGHRIVASPHVGDLDTPEALDGLNDVVTCLPQFLDKTPEVVAVDLHPDMESTRLGRRVAQRLGVPVVEVQHHLAHAVACLTEHGHESGLVLAMDGTGLGLDGDIWGAELLDVQGTEFRRLATFRGVPLPGGDAAVVHPVRQLVARWWAAGMGSPSQEWLDVLGITEEESAVWVRQCERGLNTPTTHAAGRLFDAFAALLGVAPPRVTYEGQAPIRLEALARTADDDASASLPFELREADGMLEIDWSEAFRALDSPAARNDAARWALALHCAVAEGLCEMISYAVSHDAEPRAVALTGGVFMNRILNNLLVPRIEAMGLPVLRHRETPPNDGCIAFGQAVLAGRMPCV